MRIRTLLWMLLISNGLWAQITLTIDDAPAAGDTLIYVTDTLVANLTPGMSGPDQTWDYSQLGVSEVAEIRYIAPEDAPNNDAFPDANLAQELDGIFNFIEVDISGIFALGASIDFFGNGDMLVAAFEPPQIVLEFPSTFGDSFQDTTTFVIQIEDPIFGSDSLRVTQVIMQESLNDAYGMLTTPGGTFETLRREIITTTTTTIEALFLGNWVVVQNTTGTNTAYDWIAADGRTQVLTITFDEMGNAEDAVYQVEEAPGMAPEASFIATTLDGSAFNFIDDSTNDPTAWSWDFGDGNTSDQQNPDHTYSEVGLYTVCLIASNFFGADTTCQEIEVVFAPIAGFSFFEDTAGKFSFTDESINNPATWFWDFGDGNSSTDTDPTHSYTMIGDFTVCLTVGNAAGVDQTCQNLTVVLSPEASFTFADQGAGNIKFTDFSSNAPTAWEWGFGDGNSSTEQHPLHTYLENGVYTVCLKASNSAGFSTACKEVEVVVTSIDPLDPKPRMVVFPNPASTQVELYILNHHLANHTLSIVNMLGQQVFLASAKERHSLDVSNWSKGSYFYLLQNEDGELIERGKIQVQ